MKKMKIEKQLIFADQVKRIVSLNVTEHLTYRHEADGIRASGPLDIEGSYEGEAGIERFHETLEMDVLAPNHKLNGRSFALSVNDFQGNADGDSIHVTITLDIAGISEEQTESQAAISNSRATPKPLESLVSEAMSTPSTPISTMTKADSEPVSASITSVQEIKENADREDTAAVSEDTEAAKTNDLDDLFQDAESTYTSYRIIVAKPNDTYTAIAKRYDVDESDLRETNKNKEILPKTLVILPFA